MVPWCDDCSRFLTPTSLATDGSCPTCGRAIATAEAEPKAPWHFKLLVLAVVVYLTWRFIQVVGWVL